MRFLLLLLCVMSGGAAQAQATGACATQCNSQSAECMKTCTGDPRTAQQPERRKHLVGCVRDCQAVMARCKAGCGEARPRPPGAAPARE